MAKEKAKYLVFIIVLVSLFLATALIIAFSDLIIQNWFWFALLIVFIYVVTKYDVLLQLVDFQRAVIYRFGKVNRVGGPGWAFLIPFIETATLVDLRTKTIDVPKQDIVTKDGIELTVDGVIYIKIKKDRQSVVNSVIEVEDYQQASKLYVISSLRDIMGSMDLSDIISNIEVINAQVKESLERISKEWGVSVDSVEIKDVQIPSTVLEAMHEEKAAVQQKLARMERALAHKAEIQAVKEAAAGLDQKALTYYYIKAIEGMSKSKGSQVFFPAEFSKLAGAFAGSKNASPKLEKINDEYKEVLKDYIDDSVAKAKGEPKKKSSKKKASKKKAKKKVSKKKSSKKKAKKK